MVSPLSLYIHVPYCIHKCSYCDFFSVGVGAQAIPSDAYAARLCAELTHQVATLDLRGRTLGSIFFGGGTPSMMDAADLARVITLAREYFACADDLEITCEANPETIDAEKLRGLRDAGVNRLSIGVQSFQPRHLAFMERVHSPERAIDAVRAALVAGFRSVNADLIFAQPDQTRAELENDLAQMLALGMPHISAYQLTVEQNTPLAVRVGNGAVQMPNDDTQLQSWQTVRQHLSAAGLPPYEISNYAKPGHACRHNQHYWRGGEYLGIGAGAVSRVGNRRWRRARQLPVYLAGALREDENEILTPEQLQLEVLLLGLRTSEGVKRADFAERFGVDLLAAYPRMAHWIDSGHARLDRALYLTETGLPLLDTILSTV